MGPVLNAMNNLSFSLSRVSNVTGEGAVSAWSGGDFKAEMYTSIVRVIINIRRWPCAPERDGKRVVQRGFHSRSIGHILMHNCKYYQQPTKPLQIPWVRIDIEHSLLNRAYFEFCVCVSPETKLSNIKCVCVSIHFLSLEKNRGVGRKINIMINRHQAMMINVREKKRKHLQLAVTSNATCWNDRKEFHTMLISVQQVCAWEIGSSVLVVLVLNH